MVERGGLEYPIRVEDQFSENVEKFRKAIDGAADRVERVRKQLAGIRNATKDFRNAAKDMDAFSKASDRAAAAAEKTSKTSKDSAKSSKDTAKAKKDEATATEATSKAKEKELSLGQAILAQARQETKERKAQNEQLRRVGISASRAGASLQKAGDARFNIGAKITKLRKDTDEAARSLGKLRSQSEALRAAQAGGANATELFNKSLERFNRQIRERAIAEDVARRKIQAGLEVSEREARLLTAAEQANQQLLRAKRQLTVEQQKEVQGRRKATIEAQAQIRAYRQLREEAIRARTAELTGAQGLPGDLRQQAAANLAQQLRSRQVQQLEQQLIRTDKRFASLGDTIDGVNQRANRISFTFRRLIGIMAAFTIVRRVVQLFRDMISASIEFNRRIEQSTLGIASIIAAAGEVRDPLGNVVTGARALEIAIGGAREQIQLLRSDSLQTIATFDELVNAFQLGLGPGLAAGLNLNEIREFAVRISQAAAAIGLNQRQLAEEIRAILSATARPGITRIADVLQINNEDLRNAREAGKLIDFLRVKFGPFETAGKKALETFDAAVARARDGLLQLFGTGNQAFFDQFKGLLNDIRQAATTDAGGVIQADPKAVRVVALLGKGLEAAVAEARRLGEALEGSQVAAIFDALGRSIALASELLGALIEGILAGFGDAIGIVLSLVDAIREFFGFTDESGRGILSVVTALARAAAILGTIVVLQRTWLSLVSVIRGLYLFIAGSKGLAFIWRVLTLINKQAIVWSAITTLQVTQFIRLSRVVRIIQVAFGGFLKLLAGGAIIGAVQLIGKLVFNVDILGKLFGFIGDVLGKIFGFLGGFGDDLSKAAGSGDDLSQTIKEAEEGMVGAKAAGQDLSEVFKRLAEDAKEASEELQIAEATLNTSAGVAQQISASLKAENELAQELADTRKAIGEQRARESASAAELASIEGRLTQYTQNRADSIRATASALQTEAVAARQIEDIENSIVSLRAQREARTIQPDDAVFLRAREGSIALLTQQLEKAEARLKALRDAVKGDDKRAASTASIELKLAERLAVANNENNAAFLEREQLTEQVTKAEEQLNRILEDRLKALGLPRIEQLKEENDKVALQLANQLKLNKAISEGTQEDVIRQEAENEISLLKQRNDVLDKGLATDVSRLEILKEQFKSTGAAALLQGQIDFARQRRTRSTQLLEQDIAKLRLDAEEKIAKAKERQEEAANRLRRADERRALRAISEAEQTNAQTRAIEARLLAEEALADAREKQIAAAASGLDAGFITDRAQVDATKQILTQQLNAVQTAARIRADELSTLERIAREEGKIATAQELRVQATVEANLAKKEELDITEEIARVRAAQSQRERLAAQQRIFSLKEETAEINRQAQIQLQLLQAQISRDPEKQRAAQLDAEVAQAQLQIDLAERALRQRLAENLARRQGTKDQNILNQIAKEYEAILENGKGQLEGLVIELRKAQEEQRRLQAITSDPIGEGLREGVDELLLTSERFFELVKSQTQALITGIADTLASVVVAAFDPSQNVDAAEAFGRLLQSVAQEILSQVFQDLIARLLTELGLKTATEGAETAAEVAAATEAGVIRTTTAAEAATALTTAATTAAASLTTGATTAASTLTPIGASIATSLSTAATTAAGALQGVALTFSGAASTLAATAPVLTPAATILQAGATTLAAAAATLLAAAQILLVANSIGATSGAPGAAKGGKVTKRGILDRKPAGLSPLFSRGVGMAFGGSVRKALQSMRPTGLDPRDVIPAWLRVGEHVMPPERVSQYGVDFLESLRHGLIDPAVIRGLMGNKKMHGQRARIVRRSGLGFAEGGSVAPIRSSTRDDSATSTSDRITVLPVMPANESTMETLIDGGQNALRRFLTENADAVEASRESERR